MPETPAPTLSLFDALAQVGSEVTVALLPARFELGSVRLATVILKNVGPEGISERPGEDLLLTPPVETRLPRGERVALDSNGSAPKSLTINDRPTDEHVAAVYAILDGSDLDLGAAVAQLKLSLSGAGIDQLRRKLAALGLRRCVGCSNWFESRGRAKCLGCG